MRAFLTSLAVVAVISTVAGVLLNRNADYVSEAYTTSSVRLGNDGGTNLIGGPG